MLTPSRKIIPAKMIQKWLNVFWYNASVGAVVTVQTL